MTKGGDSSSSSRLRFLEDGSLLRALSFFRLALSSFRFALSSFRCALSSFRFALSSFRFALSSFRFAFSSFRLALSSFSLSSCLSFPGWLSVEACAEALIPKISFKFAAL